jgi:hypothetical protein
VVNSPAFETAVPTVTVTTSATALRLSDAAELTLTAGGPAPLRVELPKELLAPETAVGWQLVPVGPPVTSPDGTSWVQKRSHSTRSR